MPDEPEPMGLLALMRLHLARADARFGPDGGLVLLADQDRSRWDAARDPGRGRSCCATPCAAAAPGRYQLQAAIVASHALAPAYAATDWAEIVALYDRLLRDRADPGGGTQPGRGPRRARRPGGGAVGAWSRSATRLGRWHLFHAARGEMLRRLGRIDEARQATREGLELAEQPRRAARS